MVLGDCRLLPIQSLDQKPTDQLKKYIIKIITANDAKIGSLKLTKITKLKNYQPRYIYSKTKPHKHENPIRPIISQIPTPVHHI